MPCLTLLALALMHSPASDLKSDEVVVFYPGYARLDEDGKTWTALIHGSVMEPEGDSLKRSLMIAAVRRQLHVQRGTPEARRLRRRLGLFLVDHERGKTVWIRVGSQTCRLGESGPNGHFRGEVRISAAEARRLASGADEPNPWISFRALLPEGDRRRFSGRAQLIGSRGLSIISDIDDTIKDSRVSDRRELLANTFLRGFRAVPGMADRYRRAADAGATFHYVSGSPWQLYRPLREFLRAEGFPPGSFHLKHFRLTDASLLGLLGSQEATKTAAIASLLAAFPKRRFILVGDSAEEDPEIYGKLARRHPQQIVAVFVRHVARQDAHRERLQDALKGIDPDCREFYRNANELDAALERILRTHANR